MYSTNVANVRLQTQADHPAETSEPANDNQLSTPIPDDHVPALGYAPTPAEVANLIAQFRATDLAVDQGGLQALTADLQSGARSVSQCYADLLAVVRAPAANRVLDVLDRLYDRADVLELRFLSPVRGVSSMSFNGRLGNDEERSRMAALIQGQMGQRNLYVGINPRAEALAGVPRPGSGEDVLCRRHIVLDLDDHSAPESDPDRTRTRDALRSLRPALVSRSGNGWHYWFQIDVLTGDEVETWTPVLGSSMATLHADNMAAASHIIRLPYSINIPDERKRGRGATLALAVPEGITEGDAREWPVADLVASLTDVAKSLGFDVTRSRGSRGRKGAGRAHPNNAHSGPRHLHSAPDKPAMLEMIRLLPNDDKYDRDWQVNVALAVRGAVKGTSFDDADIRSAFLDFSARYPGDPAEDAALYDSIRDPGMSWPHLVDMLALTNPAAAQEMASKAGRAAFANAPIDPAQRAVIAAMPPVEEPGVPVWAARLNKRFAYVMALDRVIEIDPATGNIVDRHTLQAFRTFHDGDEQLHSDGSKVVVGLGSAWLKSRHARRYERTGMWPIGQEPAGVLNVWRGLPNATSWPVVPPTSAAADPLSCVLEFINGTIASGRADVANQVLNWIAWKVQNPLEAPGTTLALIGKQGTGKTTLTEMVIDVLGPRNAVTASTERQMVGNFNAHFEDKLVAVFEEAFLARDPRMAGPFKDLVTGARLHIENKGRDVRDVPNRLAIMVTSNDVGAVPLEPNDRRTTLIRVSSAHSNDGPYFDALREAWTNGGREAFIDFLLATDLSGFDPRRPLNTPEKAEALAESGDPIVRFWGQLLADGEPVAPWDPQDTQDWAAGGVFMSNADLYSAFQTFARANGVRYLPSSSAFGRRIDELCPGRREARRRVHGSHQNGPRGHDYPALDDCRGAFRDAASVAKS